MAINNLKKLKERIEFLKRKANTNEVVFVYQTCLDEIEEFEAIVKKRLKVWSKADGAESRMVAYELLRVLGDVK